MRPGPKPKPRTKEQQKAYERERKREQRDRHRLKEASSPPDAVMSHVPVPQNSRDTDLGDTRDISRDERDTSRGTRNVPMRPINRPSSRPPVSAQSGAVNSSQPKRVKTKFGIPFDDTVKGPLRRDIPLNPPLLTLVSDTSPDPTKNLPKTLLARPSLVGEKPATDPPTQPPSIVPNTVQTSDAGGRYVSPPLGGGTLPPAHGRAMDNSWDRSNPEITPPPNTEITSEIRIKSVEEVRANRADETGQPLGQDSVPVDTLEMSRKDVAEMKQLLRDVLEGQRRLEERVDRAGYRADQAANLSLSVLRRLEMQAGEQEQEERPISDNPEYVAAFTERVAADDAKKKLLDAAVGPERVEKLDIAALRAADERIVDAAERYDRAADHAMQVEAGKVPPPDASAWKPPPTTIEQEVLECGFRFCMRRACASREHWDELMPIDSAQQQAALRELFEQAVASEGNDEERGFAKYMEWCEECADDSRTNHFEKNPRHLLVSADRSLKVDLGLRETWWTPAAVKQAWREQIQN